MHLVDIAVFLVIGLSVVIGFFRGLIREAFSLATWILGIWIALVYAASFASALPFQLESQTIQTVVAFAVLLILLLIAGGIINYLIGHLVDKSGLTKVDRVLGLFFGFLRGGLIVAILVLLATLTNMPEEPWWQDSSVLPFFHEIAGWLKQFLPPALQEHFE